MTWLKGTTTWGALPQKLAQLLCGEVADDGATTVASGDAWVREFTRTVTDGVLNSTTTVTSATAAFTQADKGANVIGAGVPAGTTIATVTNGTTVALSAAATATTSGVSLQICHDTIRTKAALDVPTGDLSNRTGYFALASGALDGTMATLRGTVAKVVNPFTSDPSTSGFHRWFVILVVQTANTVAGNYSTASIREWIFDADNFAAPGNSSRSPNAAGLVTSIQGLQYSVTDPSGILPVNTGWVRGFTSTYMYGIDAWPMLYRQGASAPAFTVNPPGVAGTDYDIVTNLVPPNIYSATMLLSERGATFHGLGIKTATGLGANPAYSVNWPMALAKGRIYASSGGVLGLDIGQVRVDAVNGGVLRNVGGFRQPTWCRCASTAGSVTSSSQVQYWISVKADGIALVLNMDPGLSGRLGTAWWGAFTPVEPTYDVFPICWSPPPQDYTSDVTPGNHFAMPVQYAYLALKRRQDGSEGVARDWQNRWMRSEGIGSNITAFNGSTHTDQITFATNTTSTVNESALTAMGQYTNTNIQAPGLPVRQAKPGPDGKWWLFGTEYGEGDWSGANAIDETRGVRGTQSVRYFFISGDSWASGDELTDTSTGTKFLLVTPDYPGLGGRIRVATNTFMGGLAVAEV